MYKKKYMPQPSGIYSRYTRLVQHSIGNRLKIICSYQFDKIQHPFKDKNFQQTRNRGELPQLDKAHLPKPYS